MLLKSKSNASSFYSYLSSIAYNMKCLFNIENACLYRYKTSKRATEKGIKYIKKKKNLLNLLFVEPKQKNFSCMFAQNYEITREYMHVVMQNPSENRPRSTLWEEFCFQYTKQFLCAWCGVFVFH